MHIERRRLRLAEPGPLNPLPNLGKPLEDPYQIGGAIPFEIIENSRYGHPLTLHPYQLQDQYSRELKGIEQTVVTLQNQHLRASFLPELGGRLWELTDLASGKNLLHTPGQIQLGNLALRNAWFAGGVEWNIGTRGHSPSTCSPLHAAKLTTPDGVEVLRMWEFDRLREVVFQIDAWLPEDSAYLQVAIRISNPHPQPKPIYWWSNAAVPQDSQTRVIAPAESAFASDYQRGISRKTPQNLDGVDHSWPMRNSTAADFFFDLAPEQRRWIAVSDAQGDGLAMLSTARLRGRKLFVWGEGQGGQRWQEWLSPDGGRYAEIQAGLAQTQFENLPLPANESWSWLECYGNAGLDAEPAHAAWPAAVQHAEERLAVRLPKDVVEQSFARWQGWADLVPEQQIQLGSGWGALEAARRRHAGSEWQLAGTPFPVESLGEAQRPWLQLLKDGTFDGATSYVSGSGWRELLKTAQGDTAQIALHSGILAQAEGDLNAASELYRTSLEFRQSAMAWRCLALAEDNVEHYLPACAAGPADRALLTEAVTALLAAGKATEALGLLEGSPRYGAELAAKGRLALLSAQALAAVGRTAEASAILQTGLQVADIREGENSLAQLWQQLFPSEPIPDEYQFSMS
ncbi:cell wall assembly regulator SMI1 [Psychromicrobium silvestre]|uniref:Cell wall assembly regulator SMI1 n=1 Tax=Psychromicrobium silvestre TaxID=1645614 RepID=A0A7Y9LVQ6_9MICC|nr:DUF5107 domain-containing protein [Psychromicrobium silvestre]NYE96405.1 cell wall assembly regulator SMI1 [Psychromicrobium silvestre]